ncbi:hypothetical protein A3J20_05540 [Candidatus Gottesmanbacteria bacterium RIFCSPLOWO2_02_FULL_42_29]|uniref:Fibronectin type-III domain-containing protein n=2 Tax=Candidatus Gottesmaniibacteriota TaxID=1752720 RepID=A0A1F6BK14_9BACT|nr:MAG: hypothetical protein A2781_07345 [Candidatus Gottesmanbacteria bacterium RIFCSPHIGHO2_01_FULL_42_27]OGG20142.1 MAG: hypothetical protein A3E72_01130 [Candidatus Gottesmanbacteria bacterium RIFCSPHIGHO2_12_FULL_43_26]OGG36663.1 MAG: hypothetical protein A3J20_05540 [Candidatus Gottesmanbacteria bacterium RIFCSPLOWO2_02_FULL_42_29]OGG37218.1 MAG: hypothetical protein A2968_05290 [Candidatus Gottesmanbacteria bacterium RIFCSPLOWO2_01_FULL_42_22]
MTFQKKFITAGLAILTLVSLSAFKPELIMAGDCGGPYPPQPSRVSAKTGPGAGQVTISWDEVSYANRYAVAYGTESGHYLYGADNIGGQSSRSYSVGYLNPGQKYYFRLSAARDCSASPFSEEFSAVSGWGQVVMPKTPPTSAISAGQAGVSSNTSIVLKAWTGPGVGQVSLSYVSTDDADNYHLVYGEKRGEYQYGALNIGKTNSYTVSRLVPGRGYYFAIVPQKGDRALYTSEAVWARAYSRPAEVIQVEPNLIPQIINPTVIEEDDDNEEVNVPPVIDEGQQSLSEDENEVMGVTDERVGDPSYPDIGFEGNGEVPPTENLNYGFGD